MSNENPDRLRPHPQQRFASSQHRIDLDAAAAKLNQEAQAGEAGHRQEMLYRHGHTSVALFLFGRLTRLPLHRAGGVVTIHVLKGHLQVKAEGQVHDLHANNVLALAPDVKHDVVAQQESQMLLTMHLDDPSESGRGASH